MRLFKFTTSCYSAKVAKCLDLKGLAYTSEEIPYFDRQELVRASGDIKAPVLVDGGRALTESSRISAYLDETYRPTLRPDGLLASCVVHEQWADDVLEDAVFRLAAPHLGAVLSARNGDRADVLLHYRFSKERKYGAGCLEAWERDQPGLEALVVDLLAPLDRTLARRAHVLGDAPTLADAAVWGNLTPLELGRRGWLDSTLPEVASWFHRLAAVCTDASGPWLGAR
jgi:glutathione S-transferase